MRVALLATGGTIAGVAPSAGQSTAYESARLSVDRLLDAIPLARDLATIEAQQIARIDSKDADPAFWQTLGQACQQALDEGAQAVVVTHGTDTLEESAAYLHWTLKTERPVILTAAMRPASAISADGPGNLLDSLRLAVHPQAMGLGVLACLNQTVWSARGLSKVNAQRPDAFAAPGAGALGSVQDGVFNRVLQPARAHTTQTRYTVRTPLAQVHVLCAYAGASPRLVQALLEEGTQGIIWAGTGNGSMSAAMQQALHAAAQAGVAVVRASRTGSGHVMHGGDCPDEALGFNTAGSLSPWQARVLLALELGRQQSEAMDAWTLDRAAIQQAFERF